MDTKERDEDEVVEEEAWDEGVLAHQPKSSEVARASMRSRAPIDINLRRKERSVSVVRCRCWEWWRGESVVRHWCR